MSGIYIHIPFCEKACHYCNFHFSTSLRFKQQLVDALVKEIKMRKDYISSPLTTIYFGGGTPSLLNKQEISAIFSCIYTNFNMAHLQEITIEVNPNDVSRETLLFYLSLGINRLSIGVQSFINRDLQDLNRSHNREDAIALIKKAQDVGFVNMSIDLIYGIPQMSDSEWQENINTTIELNIPHISCYCLTVEEKTALAYMIKKGKVANIDEYQGARHFEMLMATMHDNDYLHYEISNFCKDELFSKHNSSYWSGKEYLGIGPSAHSYNGQYRQWNISNNKKYIEALEQNTIPSEQENLTTEQKINEYIMTSLRTMWGCSLELIEQKYSTTIKKVLEKNAQKYIQQKMLSLNNNNLTLTKEGKLIADHITMNLFF